MSDGKIIFTNSVTEEDFERKFAAFSDTDLITFSVSHQNTFNINNNNSKCIKWPNSFFKFTILAALPTCLFMFPEPSNRAKFPIKTGDQLIKTLHHSTMSGQKLDRVPVTTDCCLLDIVAFTNF